MLISLGSRTGLPFASAVIFLFLVGCCGAAACAQVNDEGLKERFLQEAPARWKEYARLAEMLQGKARGRWLEGTQAGEISFLEFKTNGRGKICTYESRLEKTPPDARRSTLLYGANSRYAFSLQRKDSGSPWALLQIVDLDKEVLPDRWKNFFDVRAIGARALMELDSQSLLDMVESSTFRVHACRMIQREGEELAEISFSYDSPSGRGARAGTVVGKLV